jgi:hypothetical protein
MIVADFTTTLQIEPRLLVVLPELYLDRTRHLG